jgi:dihydroxy-acid dehydratase
MGARNLSEAEMEARLDERNVRESPYEGGILEKYQRDFGSAANGAVTNPKAQWE